jgi:hypothetical protein
VRAAGPASGLPPQVNDLLRSLNATLETKDPEWCENAAHASVCVCVCVCVCVRIDV